MTWTDVTVSNTTNRNTSRFLMLRKSTGSVAGGVDFALNLRTPADSRGAAFLITTSDPVRLHGSGDSTI